MNCQGTAQKSNTWKEPPATKI